MAYKSFNPFTLQEIASYPEHTVEEIQSMLGRSNSAFLGWRRYSLNKRLERVSQIADHLEDNYRHYAIVISQEMGKKIEEANQEVIKCALLCRYYIKHSGEFLKKKSWEIGRDSVRIQYDAQGAIFGVMPWNYPFWQVFRFAIPNLILGNTILLKHASNVGGCANQIESIFTLSGFPKDVYQNVRVSSSRVEELIGSSLVRGVSLTGSENAGRSVAEISGRHLKKVVLELGGSNSFIVLPDASIRKAVKAAVQARLVNSGQSCISGKRFIVHKSLLPEFTKILLSELSEFRVGDPMLASTSLAPLARLDLVDELERQILLSIEQGAKCILRPERRGCMISPTVLTKVKPGNVAFDEELFGPVFSLCSYNTLDQAIELSNSSRFGLGATVFGRNKEHLERFANELDEGAVFFNYPVRSNPALPFGGVKNSGFGREMGIYGMLEFANIKSVFLGKKK